MSPPSASLSCISPALTQATLQRPGPALDQTIAASPSKAAETSSDETAKDLFGGPARYPQNTSATAQTSPPSFAEGVFPQLPFLMTRRTSSLADLEMLVYGEQVLAERQADFHMSLCARLEEVEQVQGVHRRWLAMRAEAGFPASDDLPARTRYIYEDESPTTPWQVEVVGEEVDEDGNEDYGPFLSPPTLSK